ncbi:MAG: hypothetical protein SFY69_04965 [Planctomycetota bacterium]|nr:hypothetical protein [Planctomycetota bacterium]
MRRSRRGGASLAGLLAGLIGVAGCDRQPAPGVAPGPSAAGAPAPVAPGTTDTLDAIFARSHAAYAALLREDQPATGEDALAVIEEAGARVLEVERSLLESGDGVQFDALWSKDATPAQRDAARRGVEGLEAAGVGALIAKAAALPRAVPVHEASGPLIDTKLPQLGRLRSLTRLNSARAVIALEAGDAEAFVERVGEILALGVHGSRQGPIIAHLVGFAVQSRALEVIRQGILTGRLDDASLARLASLIEEQAVAPLSRALRAERLLASDTIEFVYFTGPEGLAYLRGSTDGAVVPDVRTRVVPEGRALGPGMPDRATQQRLSEEAYDLVDELAAMLPAARRGAGGWERLDTIRNENLLLGILMPALDKALASRDMFEADRSGTRALLALARAERALGAPPETLAALVPAFVAGVPVDPYTGHALGYMPPSKGPYEGGRRFVLYAAGPDGTDDGGKVDFAEPLRSQSAGGAGLDFLLNRESAER